MMTMQVTEHSISEISRLNGAKFATPAFSDTNQTSTGRPEASFRSTTALWDYVPLMALGDPTSVMIEQGAGFMPENLHWRMYQAQLNYYICTYAHLHRPRRRGSGGK
eukprot:1012351-Rhodomonas_salina.1